MLKILVIGLGSVGRRHLKCLSERDGIEVAALRTSKGTLKEASGGKEFFSISEALAFKPDGVIISNPTSLHIATALPFLQSGIRILIEKPIAASCVECEHVLPYASLIRVAYCMRFHSLNARIKSVLQSEKPFKAGFKRSYYLPKWHAYADYKTEYTARKELGGGVVRTLSHEIDLMLHWFDKPHHVTGVIDKVSDLEIDTDDYAFFTCRYDKGFRVNFELDFLSPLNINTGELFTDKGKYHWDLTGIWFTPYHETIPHVLDRFDERTIDRMYQDQINDFIGFVESGESENAMFTESLEVLKIIESLEA